MSGIESRLLEALAKVGNAQGFGLKSEGVGKAPEDLIKEFQEAMAQADSQTDQNPDFMAQEGQENKMAGPAEQMPDTSTIEESPTINPLNGVNGPQEIDNNPTQKVDKLPEVQQVNATSESMSIDGKNSFRAENVNSVQSEQSQSKPETSDDLINELNTIIESFSQPGATLGHLDLYRVQYIMGMLKTQSTSGMKMSQSVSQGLESLLKQQG